MAIRIVRLGSPRAPDEGLRPGTVRRPPRGVRRADTNLAVGCYCADESHCHRSLLRDLLVNAGAEVVPAP